MNDINYCISIFIVCVCNDIGDHIANTNLIFLSVRPGIAITTERESIRPTTPISETDSPATVSRLPTRPTTRSTASKV